MLKVLVGTRGKGEELKWENLTSEDVLVLAATQALFPAQGGSASGGGGFTYVLTGALGSSRGEEFLALTGELAASPHTFIFEEEKLLKRETDIVTKAGATIERREKTPASKHGFDLFGVTAALGSRDKKKLWLALIAALRAGEKAEALAGLLAWKARQMKDAELSRRLTFMYHDAHRGMGSLELLLERFALKL